MILASNSIHQRPLVNVTYTSSIHQLCGAITYAYNTQHVLRHVRREWALLSFHSVCCVTSRTEWALLSFPDVWMFVCLFVCLSVSHPTAYSLPRLIDHNQIWYAGTYLSSHACKPFWIPCLTYSRFQTEKYGKFSLFPTLNGCHFDTGAQIKKSQRESMRMSMASIVPKKY